MTFCASKTVNGVTTNHIWDGSNIVAETDGNKQVTAKYYRGSGLISQEVSNTESYYQFNMHGDVIGLTGANGELIEDYDYDAFGNQINQSTEKSTPFRYAGEYYDEETDLIYLRNRYYSPTVGQFITEDPIHDGGNWYAYCYNNPVKFIDPMGLKPGDEFVDPDAAFLDMADYINEKSINDLSEYASPIYYVVRPDGSIYYTYDEPWNDVTQDQNDQFQINFANKNYLNRIVAIGHSHGAYDKTNNNSKDGFSSPGNSLSTFGFTDTSESDNSNLDYYVVTPAGNVYRYDANSGNPMGQRLANNMYQDPEYVKVFNAAEKRFSNTLIMRLLENKFPNADRRDIINAIVKFSDIDSKTGELEPDYLSTIEELEYYCS